MSTKSTSKRKCRYIDYKLKAEVLKTGVNKKVSSIDRAKYLLCRDGIIPSYDVDSAYIDVLFKYGKTYIDESRKINNASYKRVERLKERIKTYLLMGQCIFLTLSFKPSVLAETSKDTRRQYVRKYLKEFSDYFVANIDFGGKNGREHYHAIIVADKVDYSIWRTKCGRINGKLIHSVKDSEVKLAKYVSKLTNHAIKETTKRNCYIYSRS